MKFSDRKLKIKRKIEIKSNNKGLSVSADKNKCKYI